MLGGQQLLLDEELDLKLHTMIITPWTAGAGIKVHVVRDVLNDLSTANPEKFGRYIDFHVSQSWVDDKKKKKLYGPFLWMGFNCLKARATLPQ